MATSPIKEPAPLKGPAGSGIASALVQQRKVVLSPDLKSHVREIIRQYSGGKDILTPREFADFLRSSQDAIADKAYENLELPIKGDVTSEALEGYLLSSDNEAVQVEEQDLTKPLSDYFISSSHNTYLVGNQVAGEASTEGYISVLKRGCRSVEIDVWDGENGEPKVVHG
jgi:phosphatidylinositol phospholipase C, delta